MDRFLVQKDGSVVEWTEKKLRRRLRSNDLTGLELACRVDDEQWRPLHTMPVFREEVPHQGDPRDAARRRVARGFGWHALIFVAVNKGRTRPLVGEHDRTVSLVGVPPRRPPTDAALLSAWRRGDADAGNALAERYYPRILRFFELKAQWVAADLTQKTFLACAAVKDRLDDSISFRGYLFGIARNQLLMYLRSQARQERNLGFGAGSPNSNQTGMSTLVARAQEQRVLLQGLVSLPVDTQMLLGLHYWESMTSRELGQALEIPAATVRGRLMRARQQLREAIEAVEAKPATVKTLLSDIDRWARSLVPDAPQGPG